MEYEKHRDMDSLVQPSAPRDMQYPPPYPGLNSPPPLGSYPYPSGMQGYPPSGYANLDYGQHVVFVSPQQPVMVVAAAAYVPMTGAIVLSCFVFWCCGMVLGGVAFILALIGENSSSKGDAAGAIKLRNASYGVSAFGIGVGIILFIIFFTLILR